MKWRSLEESEPGIDSRPLREILAERQEKIVRYVLPQTQAVHARVIDELSREGIVKKALSIGAQSPNFSLSDHNGKTVSSADLLAKGPLIICFVRGRWCPFCVAQLEAMNRILPQIASAGALLIAISPQTIQQSFFMADQHKLRFPLLSDFGNQVAKQFRIAYRVSEDQQSIYRRSFVNLPFINGDESWELPIPSTFIIDGNGTILFASVNPDYTQRPEPALLLEELRRNRLPNRTERP
jgi:peroxiredoxin